MSGMCEGDLIVGSYSAWVGVCIYAGDGSLQVITVYRVVDR